ncbi:hypothetical protein JOL79_06970 [Microbispora sp. RL4-1S]|uniref:Uncharacterized protein n=1 Tax=Microbispora oryzae TaxID=2806554 RepID=A0A941AH05_9ACTN|nr:hypothetical protein [Microbispora oryzae]MBP2703540.1 hypothetical protein [Microbispora oryzae]
MLTPDPQQARGIHVDGSGVVHLAGSSTDHHGEVLPSPGCNTGLAGWDPRRLRFTDAPINCRKCQRLIAARQLAVPVEQIALPI